MELYKQLKKAGFQKQTDKMIDERGGDIDGDFLGFTDIYKHLAEIIPKELTIIDLGCAYGFQSYYFRKHKKYIGIDLHNIFFREVVNAEFCQMSIKDYLKKGHYTQKKSFAIMSYVPSFKDEELVKKNFQNLFIYYPR